MQETNNSGPGTADICLIVEGSYPYTEGGVSIWIQQILKAFPDLTFSIFHIGASRDESREQRYTYPANVLQFEEAFLFDTLDEKDFSQGSMTAKERIPLFKDLEHTLIDDMPDDRANALLRVLDHVAKAEERLTFDDLWRDPQMWELLRRAYRKWFSRAPFLDFFWSTRSMSEQLWRMVRAGKRVPQARQYHAVCTGWAGLMGAFVCHQRKAPLLLTEHGIYVKERIEELQRSEWIYEPEPVTRGFYKDINVLRQAWIEFFKLLAQLSYENATGIVSLFQKNANIQIEFGAASEKIAIIPNGVNTNTFDHIAKRGFKRLSEGNRDSFVVGSLSRIVPIKDLKTLLRTAQSFLVECPQARFLIAGPSEEEPEYYDECLTLCDQLGIEKRVDFRGTMDRETFFDQVDVLLLTSISEGLPFVILEAMAAGKPVVATDVGACRELLNGRKGGGEPAGILAEVRNPTQIAAALYQLWSDMELRFRMGQAGRKRIAEHYTEDKVVKDYRKVYDFLDRKSRLMDSVGG